jgi:hypothetical protein
VTLPRFALVSAQPDRVGDVKLFRADDLERIDTRRSQRRQQTSRNRHQDGEPDCATECDDIGWVHTGEHGLQCTARGDREGGADENAKKSQVQTASQHHGENAAAFGAERDPDTDLARALRHVVSEQSVQADARLQKCDSGERADYSHLNLPRSGRCTDEASTLNHPTPDPCRRRPSRGERRSRAAASTH